MADRYWVGGTAAWDATAGTKWATTSGGTGGAAVPTASDDVYFDAASGAVTVSVNASSVCRNLNFTGFTGTFAGSSALAVSGDLVLSAAMTLTYSASTTFNSTAAQTITTNGKAVTFALTFNGAGGSWQLQDNLTASATNNNACILTAGTLDLNGKALSLAGRFTGTGTTARGITSGGGSITLTGSNNTLWSSTTLTNFTLTGALTVNCTYSGATGTRQIDHGSTSGLTEANAVSFNISAGTDTITIFGALNIDFTGFAGTLSNSLRTLYGGLTISSGMTVTGGSSTTNFRGTSGPYTITTAGKTIDFPLTFNGIGGTFSFADALTQGSTRAFTITNGTVKLKNGVTSTVGAFATSGR